MLEGVRDVDNHFDRTVLDEAGEFGQVLTARMHEEIAVARSVPAGVTPQGKAGNPKQRLQPDSTPQILRCRLRLRHLIIQIY